MREILFRGKDVFTNEWVYGGYGLYPHTRFPAKPTIYEAEERACWRPVEVIPETVGQYTGLKGRNGKMIFEGDIVRLYSEYHEKLVGENCVVKYGEFNCTCCNGIYGWEFVDGDIRNFDEYEIIGNIHDNPELLKEE